ncbi:hypothetical protein GCM10010502_51280 [Kitasatospora aureofaciens]|uniref:Uncharacterized protein n=1 Tax=Kitasatospora aureofaciens TaxID=1894 RepID=A0A8H9HVF1_KITAU|nr:hypothetical protein GCM10010502_51280 [Kitasatospora aureofaciens]
MDASGQLRGRGDGTAEDPVAAGESGRRRNGTVPERGDSPAAVAGAAGSVL